MRLGLLPCAIALVLRVTAAEIGGDVAVALPPFLVEEVTKGPPWRYGEAMGFEILSRCRDTTTRRVVEAHHRLHELLAEILPPELRIQFSVPRTLILYDEELQPGSSQEVIAKMMQTTEPTPGDDLMPGPGGRGFRVPSPQRRYSFLPNLRLWDRDAMAVFMIVRRDDFDAERLSLTQDYVRFLVGGRLPTLPLWFVGGFLTLYQQNSYDGDRLTLEALSWPAPVPSESTPPDPGKAPPVGPLSDLFAPPPPPNQPSAVDFPKTIQGKVTNLWQAHAALFVRWGLDADNRTHRSAFWKFVDRSALVGTSEALFVECFGFDYAAARVRLNAYLRTALRKPAVFRLPKQAALPPFPLNNATDEQIARIKGDWERMEVPYVRSISPKLAPKYLELARRTLKRAHDRDYRDPRLLAVMGLCEVDGGNDAGAREFLESAAQLGPLRPRANYELARLRMAEHRAQPSAAQGLLGVDQVAHLLNPLFAARAAEPPLPEVYELIAEVWSLCASKPTRGHLAVLDEGVRLFPRRFPLVLRAAELNATHGFREEASALFEIASRVAPDEAARSQVAERRAQLGFR